ncbi:MAG: DNA polymerase III subunit gamma/tau [Acidobacteriia bacterium]|nr:DNA polymerase III subunit gamma/tau [Terriglobia bacterium]
MQYQVLARKWRPQTFHELVGQDHVSRTLLNALQGGRVAHAFLFSGPRGSGKTTTARILAKALNCHEGTTGEPCGKCVSCIEITAGNCMDVLEIDAASNTGVDNVRDLIEELQYRPARDRNKIYIIDEVHMLSTAAFNALLKTLEEPPPHVAFILATTEYHKIPATILSRCQQYSFKLIQFPLILERLRTIARAENIQISTTALEQITFSSGGSMRDAMSALDQVIAFSGQTVRDEDVPMLLGLVEPAILGNTVRAISANDAQKILSIIGELAAAGQDLQNFCRCLLGQLRDLMVLKAGVSDPAVLGVPESMLPELTGQAALFSREDLLRLFDALLKVEADLRHATQTRFQLEMGLIELASIPRMRSLEELIADFARLVEGGAPQRTSGPRPGLPAAPSNRPAGPRNEAPPPEQDRNRAVAPPARGASPADPAPPPPPGNAAPSPPAPGSGAGTRRLLERIATAVPKESLEPILQSLAGAQLRGDVVILDLGQPPNEFLRRQLKDNLPVIAQAASTAVGRTVQVLLDDVQADAPKPEASLSSPGKPAEEDLLERAKREPAVQAFLDTFPGPVKAEKLKP